MANPPPTVQELLTIEEVAAMLRIPVNTLRYYRHQGRGPKSAKVGSRLRYRRADVEAWLDEQFEADTRAHA